MAALLDVLMLTEGTQKFLFLGKKSTYTNLGVAISGISEPTAAEVAAIGAITPVGQLLKSGIAVRVFARGKLGTVMKTRKFICARNKRDEVALAITPTSPVVINGVSCTNDSTPIRTALR